MQRIPEPELMLDEAQVLAYAEADFATPHDHLIALLKARFPDLPTTIAALDLGCGAGDISRRFARALPGSMIHGVDGSPAMLDIARRMTRKAGLEQRVTFAEVLLPAPPPVDISYDLIFSNSLLHHMADPDAFWSTLRDWAGSSGRVFVMDLRRPSSAEAAAELVSRYSGSEPEVLRTDFFNSLCAAFEIREVEAQLERAGLGTLQIETVSDRHFIAWGSAPQALSPS
jgi:cyclopropane fatty-acyl-phospholipid synthase-like methyltransferase